MNNEQYEMIAMCALAKRDKKQLMWKAFAYGDWIRSVEPLREIIIRIERGYAYKVVSEIKTHKCRIAWMQVRNGKVLHFVYTLEPSAYIAFAAHCDFLEWASDELTFEELE